MRAIWAGFTTAFTVYWLIMFSLLDTVEFMKRWFYLLKLKDRFLEWLIP